MTKIKDKDTQLFYKRIYESSLLEFALKGYQNITIEDIATKSFLGMDTIKRLFKTKNDLFIYVFKTIVNEFFIDSLSYESVFKMFNSFIDIIKNLALMKSPILEYIYQLSISIDNFNDNDIKKVRDIFLSTKIIEVIDSSFCRAVKNYDAYKVLLTFVFYSVGLTYNFIKSKMSLPPNSSYIDPFKDYFKEDNLENNETDSFISHRDFKKEKFIGTWALEFEKGKEPRLYGDTNLKVILGTNNVYIEPEKFYHVWFDRIDNNYVSAVRKGMKIAETSGRLQETYFAWLHPNGQRLSFRCAGTIDPKYSNGVRLEGILQDISNIGSARTIVNNVNSSLSISKALIKSYMIVYYVNLVDNSYSVLDYKSIFKELGFAQSGRDFFKEYNEEIEKYVKEDDLLSFNSFFDKKNLLNEIKDNDIASFEFCIKNKQDFIHLRCNVMINEDNTHLIIGMENVEKAFKKIRKSQTANEIVLNHVSSAYDLLLFVEIASQETSDKDYVYRINDKILKAIPNFVKEKNIKKKLISLCETFVLEEDKKGFIKAINRDFLIEYLIDEDSFVFPFRSNFFGDLIFYELCITKQVINSSFIGYVLGLRCIDSEIKNTYALNQLKEQQEQNQAFAKLFANTYYSAFYVNLEENTFTTFKRHKVLAEKYFELDNYEEYFRDFIEEDVFEEDRKKIIEATKISNIKEKMKENEKFSIRYRDISQGQPQWYILDIIQGVSKGSVAIGLLNIDEEVLKEQNEQKRFEYMLKEKTKELHDSNKQLEITNRGVFELLSEIVEARDKESGDHVRRVKKFTYILANEVSKQYPEYGLTSDSIYKISLASTLHDLGKVIIPDNILLKPGRLTPEEFEIMKTHTTAGVKFLDQLKGIWTLDYLTYARDICYYHHEKYDGSGYPCGLKGEEIPIAAQIVSVADCFDALTSLRLYKPPFSCEKAYNMIVNGECGVISEKILKCFANCKEEFFAAKDNPLIAEQFLEHESNKAKIGKTSDKESENTEDLESLNYEYLEMVLKELPTTIFYKDTKGRYIFSSKLDRGYSINEEYRDLMKGKTDLELMKDKEAAKRSYNDDRKIIRTGRPSKYIHEFDKNLEEKEYIEVIKKPVRNKKGKIIGIVGEMNNITERMTMEATLSRLAKTDELTGLGNRQRLELFIQDTMPNCQYPIGILMADCDRLKHINDTFGHKAGDRFLKATASTLTTSLPDNAEIFRLGGDEFLVLLPGSDKADCARYVEEITRQSTLVVKDTKVSLSIGTAVMEWPDEDFSALLEIADNEMYKVKNERHLQQAKLERMKKKR